jgi:hypothetical protein
VPDQALFDPEGSWLLQGRSRSGNYLGVSEGSVHTPFLERSKENGWINHPFSGCYPHFANQVFWRMGPIEQVEDELRLPGWVTIGSTIELTTIDYKYIHIYILYICIYPKK